MAQVSTKVRPAQMSGWCATPSEGSHQRCQDMGGGNRFNPAKEFQPCPCPCHLGERYECECGGIIAEAPLWPNEDEPGEMVYQHIHPKTGRANGEFCP